MGLGPQRSSLLQRLDRQAGPPQDTDWYEMEQQERTQARQAARIRHAMKHKAKVRPLAPVRELEYKVEGKRRWLWVGEEIASKGLYRTVHYSPEEICAAGFKLPKLVKKEKVCQKMK